MYQFLLSPPGLQEAHLELVLPTVFNCFIIYNSQTLESLSSFVPSFICSNLATFQDCWNVRNSKCSWTWWLPCSCQHRREGRGLGVQGWPGLQTETMFQKRQAGRHTHWGFLLFPPYLQYWDYINQQEDYHQMWLHDLGLELLNHPSLLLQHDCILSESIHVVQDFTRFSLQLNS